MKHVIFSSQKENKKDKRIVFEKFPNKSNKNDKKVIEKIRILLLIFVLSILLISSAFLNKWYLDETDETTYKLVNEQESSFATIPKDDRSILFKNIGFDVSREEINNLENNLYNTTYAYRKIENNLFDTINVYYEDDNVVHYIDANLFFNFDLENTKKISRNINALLNNFINYKVSEQTIISLRHDKYFYIENTNIKITMNLKYYDNKSCIINIIIKKIKNK